MIRPVDEAESYIWLVVRKHSCGVTIAGEGPLKIHFSERVSLVHAMLQRAPVLQHLESQPGHEPKHRK